jgi:hypothetical protein
MTSMFSRPPPTHSLFSGLMQFPYWSLQCWTLELLTIFAFTLLRSAPWFTRRAYGQQKVCVGHHYSTFWLLWDFHCIAGTGHRLECPWKISQSDQEISAAWAPITGLLLIRLPPCHLQMPHSFPPPNSYHSRLTGLQNPMWTFPMLSPYLHLHLLSSLLLSATKIALTHSHKVLL